MVRPKYCFTSSVTIFIVCLCINSGWTTSETDKDAPSWIMCYQCNSQYDPRCGDPFDPYSLGKVNCSLLEPLEHLPEAKPTICRKNVQKVQGKVRIVRSCGYIEDSHKDNKMCLFRSGTHDVNMQYCSCTGNLCNSAIENKVSAIVLGLFTMAAFL